MSLKQDSVDGGEVPPPPTEASSSSSSMQANLSTRGPLLSDDLAAPREASLKFDLPDITSRVEVSTEKKGDYYIREDYIFDPSVDVFKIEDMVTFFTETELSSSMQANLPTSKPPPLLSDEPAAEKEDFAKLKELLSSVRQSLLFGDSIEQLEVTTKFAKLLLSTGSDRLIKRVIQSDVVPHVVNFLTRDDVPKLQAMAARTLNCIAYGSSEHANAVVKNGAVPVLVQLMSSSSNDFVKMQAICALGAIDVYSTDIIALLEHGALQQLLSMLQSGSATNEFVSFFALKTIGDFLEYCDNAKKQILINNGILSCLKNLLTKSNRVILKEACWAIAHIARGKNVHLQAIIDEDIITPLLDLLKSDVDIGLRKAAACIIYLVTSGSPEQIRSLPCKECIEALCDNLRSSDPKLLDVCLDGLQHFLINGENHEGVNVYAEIIGKCGGLAQIRRLVGWNNDCEGVNISELAVDIWEKYWRDDFLCEGIYYCSD